MRFLSSEAEVDDPLRRPASSSRSTACRARAPAEPPTGSTGSTASLASKGAADYELSPGDVVQWDYRDWQRDPGHPRDRRRLSRAVPRAARRQEAPRSGSSARTPGSEPCRHVKQTLGDAGIPASGAALGAPGQPEGDPRSSWRPGTARGGCRRCGAIEHGPRRSGVFARFTRRGDEARAARRRRQGWCARRRPARGSSPRCGRPTREFVWLVTGLDDAGVAARGRALDRARSARRLRGRRRARRGWRSSPLERPAGEAGSRLPRPAEPAARRAGGGRRPRSAPRWRSSRRSTQNPLVLVGDRRRDPRRGCRGRRRRRAARARCWFSLPLALADRHRQPARLPRPATRCSCAAARSSATASTSRSRRSPPGRWPGLRVVVFMLAFGLFSACVDPDELLRAFRRVSYRSALTASLATRLVPGARPRRAADGRRGALPARAARPAGRDPRRACRARSTARSTWPPRSRCAAIRRPAGRRAARRAPVVAPRPARRRARPP